MKKFIAEIVGGSGGNYPGDCTQYDINAETHGEAFKKLIDLITDWDMLRHVASIVKPTAEGGGYPGDTERVTLNVWEDTCNFQVWNPATEEWEDEV